MLSVVYAANFPHCGTIKAHLIFFNLKLEVVRGRIKQQIDAIISNGREKKHIKTQRKPPKQMELDSKENQTGK